MMTYLTDKWKKGDLESGYYFFKTKYDIEIGFLYEGLKYPYDRRHNTIDDVEEVLAPVPTYQEYLESEAHCAVYSEENKQLKQFINLYSHETEVTKQLSFLLKECKEILDVLKCGSINDLTASRPHARNLLIKINTAIGESEE